jgi:hypothetical protein
MFDALEGVYAAEGRLKAIAVSGGRALRRSVEGRADSRRAEACQAPPQRLNGPAPDAKRILLVTTLVKYFFIPAHIPLF